MHCRLDRLSKHLREEGAPGCSVQLMIALSKGSPKEMSPHSFRNGSDTAPLLHLGLIHQTSNNKVLLTEKGKKLLGIK